jgi:hypothetical protein
MNETDKIIEEQFKTLPPNLQKALNTTPWKSSVKEIALLNKLNFDQVETVERETMFILYGFESFDDYIGNLMREVKVDEATATNISQVVDEKILKIVTQKIEDLEKPEIQTAPSSVPGTPPANLPVAEPPFARDTLMVKEGEKVHDVAPATSVVDSKQYVVGKEDTKEEKGSKINVPDYRYPDGKDPYREPLV